MGNDISAGQLRAWLYDGAELALLDVREPGQIADGHILFSAPLPYSRLELDLPRLVPNPCVRTVLCDAGDGVAGRAAARARALGYTRVACLAGGVAEWARAGHTLYQGVNVPSKAFGELVEHVCGTPHIGPQELAQLRSGRSDLVIVDGRTGAEFGRMNIPGAQWCPNGELALRIDEVVAEPEKTIVVNCAGRTRSIIGAQTLIDLGLPNQIVALENGTQGWTLAGLSLEHGAEPVLPVPGRDLAPRRQAAQALAERHGVRRLAPDALQSWLGESAHTLYLLDIRTADERSADARDRRQLLDRHGVVHAPGGQLIQTTDQWVGVRRARVVVLDAEEVRAPVVGAWLRRMGHDASVLAGGLDALAPLAPRPPIAQRALPRLAGISTPELNRRRGDGGVAILDLRPSADYRAGHIPGAVWTVRPRIGRLAGQGACVLVADDPGIAALAAVDLAEAGAGEMSLLDGGMAAWRAAGLPLETTSDLPPDGERIDFIAFTHGRHDGDAAASRQYLAWEIGLVDQLDAQERAVFRI